MAAGSALGGLTALRHDGLTGYRSQVTQIVLPDGARRPVVDGVEVRWSARLDDRDVHPSRSPRRTRPARSIVDAASWCPSHRLARAIVIAGVQQGLTTPAHLDDALERRGSCRRRSLIVESVLDVGGGVHSLPERGVGDLCHRAGLTITRQRQVQTPGGRFYLDAHDEELGLAIEVHGIPHLAVSQWDSDLLRANEIVIAGERLLIFSSYAIRHEPEAVVDQLRRAAASLRAA